MKQRCLTAFLVLGWVAALTVLAQEKKTETDPRPHADGKGWRLDQAKVTDPKRPRVLLIGDSILNGYLKNVIAALQSKAYVDAWVNPYHQSAYVNKLLAEVLAHGPYDIIHFNMGLHGWQKGRIPEGMVQPLTQAYLDVIKAKLPKAKIIWASSTPVTVKGKPIELDPEINSIIIEHNRLAAAVMKKNHVPVNDLYAILAPKLDLARGDQFHWKSEAYELLAKTVTAAMLRELQTVAPPPKAGSGNAPAGNEARAKIHLYLLIGQSNMAGRGKVEKEDLTVHPRVFTLNKTDEWVPAIDPLHFDKPSAGVGPGLAFGKALADEHKDVTIGLIPCAAGGSPISVWKKDGYWGQTKSKPYDETLRRVALARKRGVLKGILWHQGESDSNEKNAKLYADRLADLVKRLRGDLEAPEVPILVGGLSEPVRTKNEHARTVDQALRAFAKADAHAAYVESDKLRLMADNTHFDAASAREFGKRYAKAMLQLQKK